jgi:hypothetical protein
MFDWTSVNCVKIFLEHFFMRPMKPLLKILDKIQSGTSRLCQVSGNADSVVIGLLIFWYRIRIFDALVCLCLCVLKIFLKCDQRKLIRICIKTEVSIFCVCEDLKTITFSYCGRNHTTGNSFLLVPPLNNLA